MSSRYQIALGIPGRQFCAGASRGQMVATLGRHDVELVGSHLGAWDAFNVIWAQALNLHAAGEATHFAMLHADVAPQDGWLDILIDELDRLKADLVSAVVPLKDDRGLTSTAIGNPATRWQPWKRLTMREVYALPETFDAADAGYPGWPLLHNDGCMVLDLRKPLFHTLDEYGVYRCSFGWSTAVYRGPDGKARSARESEDWYFSRQLHALGAQTFATRKVRLAHEGPWEWTNAAPWGRWSRDLDCTAAHVEGIHAHGYWLDDGQGEHVYDPRLAAALAGLFDGQTVVDLGCGLGLYVSSLRADRRAARVDGFDGNPRTPELTGGVCGVRDLAVPLELDHAYDWVLCLEVGEHVPAQYSETLLDNLARHAGRGLVASWAVPGQPGRGHVHCLANEAVIVQMARRGLVLDAEATERLRAAASVPYFRQTLLVFRREPGGQVRPLNDN